MAVWLVRGGGQGEFEQKFIQEGRIYVTWDQLNVDLSKLVDRDALIKVMAENYSESKPRTISNWASQIWPFAHDMKKGDLIVLPQKTQPGMSIGEVTGDYQYQPVGPSPFYHWRSVKWIVESIPRSNFGRDLLFSFGALMTICRIHRNNAEARMLAMKANGWKPETIAAATKEPVGGSDVVPPDTDLEVLGNDRIAQLISAKFKGHGLTRIVEAILKTQGYTTYRSPEGADGGADILAGSGPLGFGTPRLCVEVKSESSPIDRPTVDKLLGAVSKFGAQEGLFVSWSGFKSNVQKELAPSFFKVRLWSQKELLEQLFANYEQLDEDLKAELPLKRIWTVAIPEE